MSDRINLRAHIPATNGDGRDGPTADPNAEPPCLLAALDYLSRGLSPIPLCWPDHGDQLPRKHCKECSNPGKVPIVPYIQFSSKQPTEFEVRRWWKTWPKANVGLALGNVCRIGAWDIDGPEGWDRLCEMLGGEPPDTLRFRTPGGGHRLLYLWPEGEPIPGRQFRTGAKTLTFIGHELQTAAPPSIHFTGGQYQWPAEGGPDRVEIQPATPAMIEAVRKGEDKKRLPRGGKEAWIPSREGSQSRMARAASYLANCTGAVSGQGGHARTFYVACKLIEVLGLTSEEVFVALRDHWNDKCQPPWTEAELLHKATDAWAKCGGSWSPVITGPPARAAVRSGQVGGQQLGGRGFLPDMAPSSGKARTQPAAPVPGVNVSDMRPKETSFLLYPWIARRTLHVITGEPGIGKSSFLSCLMAQASQSVVLPGAEEDVETALPLRIRQAGGDPGRVRAITEDGWKLPSCRDRLADVVHQLRAELLVIDPATCYLLEGVSENDSHAIRAYLEACAWVARETGCAVVVAHHPGKTGGNALRGSSAWKDVPRVVLHLRADEGPPARRLMSALKYSVGKWPGDRFYELVETPDAPPTFRFGDEVSPALAELVRDTPEKEARRKIDVAVSLLRAWCKTEPQKSTWVFQEGSKYGISHDTFRRAAKLLGMPEQPREHGPNYHVLWGPTPTDA